MHIKVNLDTIISGRAYLSHEDSYPMPLDVDIFDIYEERVFNRGDCEPVEWFKRLDYQWMDIDGNQFDKASGLLPASTSYSSPVNNESGRHEIWIETGVNGNPIPTQHPLNINPSPPATQVYFVLEIETVGTLSHHDYPPEDHELEELMAILRYAPRS